jgi:hypothetical protein
MFMCAAATSAVILSTAVETASQPFSSTLARG